MYLSYFTLGIISALSSLVLSDLPEPRCWTPALSPHPVIFKECYDLVTKQIHLTGSFNPNVPLIFSREKPLGPDIELPHSWVTGPPGNCIVGIDIPGKVGGTEKTSLKDIEMAARAIAVKCIIAPPHLGGILTIGWQGKLNVIITGMKRLQKPRNETAMVEGESETA